MSPARMSAGLRLRLRRSLLFIPSLYIAAACALGVLVPALDRRRGSPVTADQGLGTARDILGATATGMIAFTGFVVAGVLVIVQFAAGQYSPRLVLWFRRDPVVKHAVGWFLASFLYALVALRFIERGDVTFGPDVTVGVALALLVGAGVLFLALLQRVTDRLRPRALYGTVTRAGLAAARETYPLPLPADERERGPDTRGWERADAQVVALSGRPGLVISFDHRGLVEAATRLDATIELFPAVGEFVRPGGELLRVHGGAHSNPDALRAAVQIADERTIEQDPAFAIRIVVDVAIRALSPAVNDPTTAVQGLDVLEVMIRELAGRDLEASLVRDEGGAVRVVWRAPTWPDLLDLAFDEIRHYGASSIQICRRLRAVLEDLRADAAPLRHPAIDERLRRLDATVQATFPPGTPDHALALTGDRMGLGLSRPAASRRGR